MSTAVAAREQEPDYLSSKKGIASWLTSVDPKRVAVLYLAAILTFFAVGSVLAVLLRVETMSAGRAMLSASAYDRLFSMHGAIMVFLVLVPAFPAVLGNFFVPMMVGARGLAFPRLAVVGFRLYAAGAVLALVAAALNGSDASWTLAVPYSLHAGIGATVLAAGIALVALSSILTALNLVVTVQKMRAPGLDYRRLPLFVWGMLAVSLVQLFASPVLAATMLLLVAEKTISLGLFDPSLGGDPVLYQHLFWFGVHPILYGTVIGAMAVVSEILATFTRREVSGHRFVAGSLIALALLAFLGWGQHLFAGGLSVYATLVFSALGLLVAIPAVVIVVNWLATLKGGSIAFETPMLYALGVIVLLTIAGLANLFLMAPAVGVYLRGTAFESAALHYLLGGAALFGFLGGLHYWWPKMFGRGYNETLARAGFALLFIGFNLAFLTQFALGSRGLAGASYDFAADFQALQLVSSIGGFALVAGVLLVLVVLGMGLAERERAPKNPWGSASYEWLAASPPVEDNFAVELVMERGPYDYDLASDEELSDAGSEEPAVAATPTE